MSEHIRCENFREQVRTALSEEGKSFLLPEKTKLLLHRHGQKCEECRKWGEEFTRIPLSREQEDFLLEVYRRERTLSPVLCWSLWALGIAGTLALLAGVFFYLEKRMSTDLDPGVKVESFSSRKELEKRSREEKKRYEQKKRLELLRKEKKKKEILPDKFEYSTVSFPLVLLGGRGTPETFFKAYLGKCTIYMTEKDPSGKHLLVHIPPEESRKFLELRKRLLKKK